MSTKIQLVLSDDWELRGDGSGDMRALQFSTVRRLMDLYERHGIRGTFNVEVMQQLHHQRWGERHPELAELADEWDETVREIRSRGHDVQLHVHPQWLGAEYRNGEWRLGTRWSIADYSAQEVREMLSECKGYLEELLQPIDPGYRCVSYRGGSWFLAPSDHVLYVLAELGIVFDMTIARGLHYDLPIGKLDYREIEEPFLPYYPRMEDARRVAEGQQPIICVPCHSFRISGRWILARLLVERVGRRWMPRALRRALQRPNSVPVAGKPGDESYRMRYWVADGQRTSRARLRNLWRYLSEDVDLVSDLSQLSYPAMRRMLRDIRARARASGLSVVPVVLENHTKVIGDFEPLDRLFAHLAEQDSFEVITATELAENLRAGRYYVRTAAHA